MTAAMDKLAAMWTFVRIVDRGSLTAAANDLGTSLPTVVRTLAALEQHLGVPLLKRTTRRLHLTDEGTAYLERCRLSCPGGAADRSGGQPGSRPRSTHHACIRG
jgi:DNA-binding transcriptional LysR family regulator